MPRSQWADLPIKRSRSLFAASILVVTAVGLPALTVSQGLPLNQTGRWSPTTNWSGTAVHLALLPGYSSPYHSKVIWWYGLTNHTTLYGGLFGWNHGNDSCVTYPADFTGLTFDYPDDDRIFCSSNSQLGNGKLFAGGGTEPGTENGTRHAWVFDPITEAWTRVDSMARRRWYSSSTTLADGRSLVPQGANTSTSTSSEGAGTRRPPPGIRQFSVTACWGTGSPRARFAGRARRAGRSRARATALSGAFRLTACTCSVGRTL